MLDLRSGHSSGVRQGIDGARYALEDYPCTAELLAGGGARHLYAGDDSADAAERALLDGLGMTDVLLAAAADGRGAWLLEIYGDARSADLSLVDGVLRRALRPRGAAGERPARGPPRDGEPARRAVAALRGPRSPTGASARRDARSFAAVKPALLAAALCLLLAAPALAVPPQPIPEGPNAGSLPVFSGQPATQHPVAVPDPPRHPFMAPNGRSNLHVDGYQSDVHQGPGPLGRGIERRSTFLEGVCASVTFDSRGRIVTVCVGVEGPKLLLLEPRTLETLAVMPLPPRQPGGGNLFTDFAGGGYFYLDNQDRAVIPTTTRHVYVVRETGGGTGFAIEHDYDLSTAVLPGDKIISALPDWGGRLWFASTSGVVGTIDPSDRDGALAAAGRADRELVRGRGHRRGLPRHRRGDVPARGRRATGSRARSGARRTRTRGCRSRASRAPARARRRR